jgi:ribosomal protein S13
MHLQCFGETNLQKNQVIVHIALRDLTLITPTKSQQIVNKDNFVMTSNAAGRLLIETITQFANKIEDINKCEAFLPIDSGQVVKDFLQAQQYPIR